VFADLALQANTQAERGGAVLAEYIGMFGPAYPGRQKGTPTALPEVIAAHQAPGAEIPVLIGRAGYGGLDHAIIEGAFEFIPLDIDTEVVAEKATESEDIPYVTVRTQTPVIPPGAANLVSKVPGLVSVRYNRGAATNE
jgi:hypothetical protein